MTKEEYIEFTNLQSHFEFLHADYDRKIEKLHSFKTDSKDFDEFLEEAVHFYFNTKINEAWKKIEEFKTATAKTGNKRTVTAKTKNATTLIFKTSNGKDASIMRDALEKACRCCHEFECDDPRNPCPFKKGGQFNWFRDCFKRGCPDIFGKYYRKEFKEVE